MAETWYKSVQELLEDLSDCIAVDDSGQSYLRTKAKTESSSNTGENGTKKGSEG